MKMKSFASLIALAGMVIGGHRSACAQDPLAAHVCIENYAHKKVVIQLYKDGKQANPIISSETNGMGCIILGEAGKTQLGIHAQAGERIVAKIMSADNSQFSQAEGLVHDNRVVFDTKMFNKSSLPGF